jgi:CzcA family heavy metal efflux pump
MLNRVIRLSLRHRGLVIVGAIVALLYGTFLTTTIPIDVFPDLDRPRVVLMTEATGLSPEEVEALVSQPVESAILGAPGVEVVRSQASNGLVITYVEFDWQTDVRQARQVVQERLLTLTGQLPDGIRPIMTPPSSIMGQVIHLGISWKPDAAKSDAWQRRELRTLADWVIRPQLLKEKGVAEVVVMGGDRKQFQVLVDPTKLLEYGITLADVEQAIRDNNLNASGGFTEEGTTERAIRVIGRLGPESEKVVDDLRKVVVKGGAARSVLLAQVARIEEAGAPKRGDAGIDGRPGVILTIIKQPHADTRGVTDRVKQAIRRLEPSLSAGIAINTELFQLKSFIDRGTYYVGEALVIGAILVVIVLFLFLLNVRTTFITLTAIPLSLAVTAIVFELIGRLTGQTLSINVMTLGGIAVAMGELVDDAIVDVENIHRRLQENRTLTAPLPSLLVVYRASLEIRSAIVFGTAVVILSFVPLFALSGIEGRLFIPLGAAYITSILASLVVSLTVTPVLSSYLLGRGGSQSHEHRDGLLVRVLKVLAGYLIRFSLRYAGVLLLLTWVAVGACAVLLSRQGKEFLPKFDEGGVQINVTLPTGSSLAATNAAARAIDAKLNSLRVTPENPDAPIRYFIRRSGRAELDEHVEPVSRSEYILTMNPKVQGRRDEIIAKLRTELNDGIPGVEFGVEQPLAHLISHMLSGVTAQIAIKISGDDLNTLDRLAKQVKGAIQDIPGVVELFIIPQETVDELQIILRPDDLAFYGLSRAYVAEFVRTAMKGDVVSQVLDGQRRFDLVVKLQEPERTDYRKLKDLRLDLPGNRGQIRLGDVADFPAGAGGPNQVNRENIRRRAVLQCNVSADRDQGSVVEEIERRIAERVTFPQGYTPELGGQFEAQRSASRRILILALVSLLGIIVVLYLLYPSARVTLQILNAIPTAFIGGVLAIVLTGQVVTIASLVGFVSLGGIAVRNGILLVTHYFHLMTVEGEPFSKETIVRGSLERLSPVLMTALTAGLGLIPLAVGGQKPGLEILYPVATVILGGLITSTLCEFLIHPGLFWKFSGPDAATRTVLLVSEGELKSDPLRDGVE